MKAATRSRWLELTKRRLAARRGRRLLEEKREALIRAVARARERRDRARDRAAAALAAARSALAEAQIELGPDRVEAAALAQRRRGSVAFVPRSLLGVAVPVLDVTLDPFRIQYAPGGTSESLDRAAAAFAQTVPLAVALAQEEIAVAGLLAGLARTNRRANALDRIILPEIESEIRSIESTLEEEARDEAVRTRRRARLASRRNGAPAALERNLPG